MSAFDGSFIWKFLPRELPYLPKTLEIWILSVLTALVLGAVAAAVRIKKIPVLNQLVRIFISYVRGTPVVAQLFLVYFGIRSALESIGIVVSSDHRLVFVIATYGLNMGAAVSENLRSAFLSIDHGQVEAADSLGMSGRKTFFRILLSQAMVVALPNFANIFVAALKNTSLAFSVGVVEMMKEGQLSAQVMQHYLEMYISLAIVYYVLYLIIMLVFRLVEKKAVPKYAVKGAAA